MSYFEIWIRAFLVIMIIMTILWIISIAIRNVSIVDLFWGAGFVVVCVYYHIYGHGNEVRKIILMSLVAIWGLRLSVYLARRNIGKGEDFRYGEFRRKYGEKRYWWISFFQTFLLQGVLMWLISAPLLAAQYYGHDVYPGILDYAGIALWIVGFTFEAGGDLQLARFKAVPSNKGKVLDKGFWHYTRHPNYFGDSAVWWGYGLICLASGSILPLLGCVLMTVMIIKVSGVILLEKSLKEKKPDYKKYIESTSSFIPWFPRRPDNQA
jgi:steroid 5-alpha reductase family enzyme